MKYRDSTFDIMKGIAMVLVILSHTAPLINHNHPFAYWRSAMFFIISGYFAKEWPFLEFMQKGAKRLIIPYIVTCLFMLPFVLLGEQILEVNVLPNVLKSMFWGAASFGYDGKWKEITIGPLWFVCASIWVRIMWSFFRKISNEYIRGCVILLLAMASYRLKAFIPNPWSIFSAFGALGFFFVCFMIRNKNLLNSNTGKKIFPITMICLVYCISFSELDINYCIYAKGLYVVELIASMGAFILLYTIVQRFSDITMYPWKFLNFFGRYSLVAFCVHSVDHCLNVHWFPFRLWDLFASDFEIVLALIMRVGFVAIGVYLVSKNKFLRERVFFIK